MRTTGTKIAIIITAITGTTTDNRHDVMKTETGMSEMTLTVREIITTGDK